MITRRQLLMAVALGLAPQTRLSLAQQQGKVSRIGFLSSETLSGQEATRVETVRAGLRDHGYVEGKNIVIEIRSADGNYDRLPGLAADLVRLKVEVIVPFGIKAILAAKGASSTIPIVMPSTSSDPVALGLVASLARPGGNITGSTSIGPETMAKRLELLKSVLPRITRVAVLVNPANRSFGPTLRQMEIAAKSLKLSLKTFAIHAPGEFDSVFAEIGKERFEAIIFQADTMFQRDNAKTIAKLSAKQRLLAIGGVDFADMGGVLSYGGTTFEQYRRAAYFVDKILQGANPGDLPIEQATKFELVINKKTAKALGITIPPAILVRANRVIE